MEIRPNYIHSVEAGVRHSFCTKSQLGATAFLRDSRDRTEWIRTAYEPGVTLDSIVNAGNEIAAGLELSGIFKPTGWWDLNVNASALLCDFKAISTLCSDSRVFCWQSAISNSFSIKKKTRIQFDSFFVGPTVLSQGHEKAYYYFNLGISHPFLKDMLRLGFSANDLLHTARYENLRNAPGLYSHTKVRPVYPNIVLSASWIFNSERKQKISSASNLFEGKDF